MTQETSNFDKWVLVAAFSLLGAAIVWQLIGKDSAAPGAAPDLNSLPLTQEVAGISKEYIGEPGGRYTSEELTYFSRIAFGAEHRNVSAHIRKWTEKINIRVEGDPTAEDLQQVESAVDLLNSLQNQIVLSIGYFETSLVIHFAPEATFEKLDTRYSGHNPGFFWVNWMEDELYRGTILIDSEDSTQPERNAMIIEELTQSLGLMNDSSLYPDSVFNDTKIIPDLGLSTLDRRLVTMLYEPTLEPGMPIDEAMEVLTALKQTNEINEASDQ